MIKMYKKQRNRYLRNRNNPKYIYELLVKYTAEEIKYFGDLPLMEDPDDLFIFREYLLSKDLDFLIPEKASLFFYEDCSIWWLNMERIKGLIPKKFEPFYYKKLEIVEVLSQGFKI